MSLYSYRPTPLEYAYASYLLTTYFAIPYTNNIPPNNVQTNNDEIRLPGKILVPFLTSAANIERSLLRLLWSTVDPENIGTLTSRTQFYVLLRLVAMEQAHFIPPLDDDVNNVNVNNNDNVNDDEKKMNVLKRTLEQTCKLVIALPTFDADTACPSVAYLMGTYPPPLQQQQQQQQQHAEVITTSAAVAQQQMSVSDAFGSMGDVEDAPLPSLETFTPPPIKEELFEDDTAADIDDDNDDLAHPLSSSAVVVVNEEKEDDGFGNFDSVEEQPIIMQIDNNIQQVDNFDSINQSMNAIETADDFGDFGGAAAPVVPPQSAAKQHDDFGTLVTTSSSSGNVSTTADGAAAANNNNYDDDIKTESSEEVKEEEEEEEDVGDDSFGDFDNAPAANTLGGYNNDDAGAGGNPGMVVLPPEDTVSTNQQHGFEHFDGQTDQNTATDQPDIALPPPTAAEENTGLSVFDALVDVQDAPLPPLSAFSPSNEDDSKKKEMAEPESMQSDDVAAKQDDEDFGDFDGGSITAGEEDAGEVSAEIVSEDAAHANNVDSNKVGDIIADVENDDDEVGFGTFEDPNNIAMSDNDINSSAADTDKEEDKISAFDALTGVEDKPLPSLSAFSFGSGSENDAEMAPITDNTEVDTTDEFGNFNATGDNTKEVISSDNIASADNFGDVEATGDISAAANNTLSRDPKIDNDHIPTPDEGTDASNGNNLASAFDAFGEVQDAPLPSLATFTPMGTIENDIMQAEEENTDDFGGFEGTSPIEEQTAPAVENRDGSNDDANNKAKAVFDMFEEVQDAPLPSLDTFTPPMGATENDNTQAELDDDFGEFDTGTTTPAENQEGPTLDTFTPMGDFAPMGATENDKAEAEVNNDESFGAFNVGDTPDKQATENNVLAEDNDDGFGDFDAGITQMENFKEATGNDNSIMEAESSFGDFNAGVTPTDDTVPAPVETEDKNDLFDAFASSGTDLQNAPAASALGDFNTDITPADQFGDFGAAEGDDLFNAFSAPPPISEDIPAADTGNGSGAFGAGESTSLAHDAAGTNKASEADDFGDFEAIQTLEVAPESEFEAANIQPSGDAPFGTFAELPPPPLGDDVDFGGVMGPIDSGNGEDFGGFEAFPATNDDNIPDNAEDNAPTAEINEDAVQNNEEEEGLGDFDAFEAAPPNSNNEQLTEYDASPETQKEEDMGDFGYFGEAQATQGTSFGGDFGEAQATTEDTSFGQFETVPPFQHEDNDDFGQFETPAATNHGIAAANDTAPANDDFGDDFGNFSSFDSGAMSQPDIPADLEEILERKLGVGRLAKDWKNDIISAVEKELQRGNKIMDYVSNESGLSSPDKTIIIKSRKLQEYILGLGEYVRIVRSITATIGELLGVDRSVDVQEATLSQWSDNSIIADVIVIEYIWSEVASKAASLDIVLPKLESVAEIRSRAVPFDSNQKENFCQLTLQPLNEKEGTNTKSTVTWFEQRYLACAANFLANR